jgi:hypothetical protein
MTLVRTILECAKEEGNNAAIRAKDNTGMIALHRAVVEGFQEIVIFAAAGRMSIPRTSIGPHPGLLLLFLARFELVKFLTGCGASRDSFDSRTQRLADLAVADDIKELVQ